MTDKELEDSSLSQADRDFETAVRSFHLEAIPAALLAGADPNRLFTDPHRPQSGCRAIGFLARPVSLGSVPPAALAGLQTGRFSRAHAAGVKAMVDAGADFSLPVFASRSGRFAAFDTRPSVNFADLGVYLWASHFFSLEAFHLFAKAGGDVSSVFSEDDFSQSAAVSSRHRTQGSAEETLGPLWETTIKPLFSAPGGRHRFLTEALGFGLLDWAQWLIDKGALPSPYPNGSGALSMLADQTANFGRLAPPVSGAEPSLATPRSAADFHACARLAVSLGENPGRSGTAQDQSILLSVFSRRHKSSPGVSLDFAQTLADLGAALDNGVGDYPVLAYALADTDNALAQMELALRLGADPLDRPRLAAMALIRAADSDQDALVSQAIERLVAAGADVSQHRHEPRHDSLIARAAAKGLWASVQSLAAAGCDPFWRDAHNGDTVMSLAAKRSADSGRSLAGAVVLARWLADQGAPIDLPGSDGMTPLHRAAKALHSELCEALLSAGANPRSSTVDSNASTPAHLACARFEKKRETAQLATLRALAQHGADFSTLDGKGRSVMEVASKKGFLSVALSVAENAQGVALDGPSGLRAAKTLAQRGEGFLAVVEQTQLELAAVGSLPSPAPKKRRSL